MLLHLASRCFKMLEASLTFSQNYGSDSVSKQVHIEELIKTIQSTFDCFQRNTLVAKLWCKLGFVFGILQGRSGWTFLRN